MYPVKIMKNWCSICRLYESVDLVLICTIRGQEADKPTKDLHLAEISSFLFSINHFKFYSQCFWLWSNMNRWCHARHSMTFLDLSFELNYSGHGDWDCLHCLLGMSKEMSFVWQREREWDTNRESHIEEGYFLFHWLIFKWVSECSLVIAGQSGY